VDLVLAAVVGWLYATGLYLMLRRSMARLIIGLALLGNAANLLIFTSAGLTRARPALVPAGAGAPVTPFADPLPQALILTAIVISFGVLAFGVVLIYRTYEAIGTDDVDVMRATDR
jgi:multicomponent Na+:H+ antiporter subunit C